MICKPYDGKEARAGNGIMISFKAPSPEAVTAAYNGGMANGGSDEGKPGFRPPDATSGFFGAYLRDPTGNKICVFTMQPGLAGLRQAAASALKRFSMT